MVARGYCVIAIDKCRAADPVATALKTGQLGALRRRFQPCLNADIRNVAAATSRAIRGPLYQHQEGRELVRDARPTPNSVEQNRSALARADSAEWTQKRVPHHRLPPQGSGAPRRDGPA